MIRLRVLGAVELFNEQGQPVHTLLAQPKRMALLALLCARGVDGFTRRDTVASYFWPERDQEHARAGLRTALHALRRALGDVFPTRGNDEIGVEAAAIQCDAAAFETACKEGRWQDANELYRGEFLAGIQVADASAELERWIDDERARYRQLATNAAWRLSAIEERRGNAPAALEVARRAVGFDPTDEVGMRRLLQLHGSLGDRAGALAAFDAFRQRLRKELEIEPSAETLALVDALRRGAPIASSPPDAAPLIGAARRTRRRWRWVAGAAAALLLVVLVSVFARMARRDATLLAAPASGSVGELARDVHGFFRLAPMGSPLSHFAAGYDAARDKVYAFGGNNGRGHSNEVWEMDSPGSVSGATWTRIQPAGLPPRARSSASAAYDSTADRVVIFGGSLGMTSPCANDTWILDNPSRRAGDARWTELRVVDAPAPRADHSAVWVPRGSRMIVFGGHDCIAQRWDDTWALDFSGDGPHWRRIATHGRGPSPRGGHSAVYDAQRDRLILFGGGSDRETRADVWELRPASSDSAQWRELTVRGSHRPAFMYHEAAWDPIGRRMIVFGGTSPVATENGVWLMRDRSDGVVEWARITPPGMPTLLRLQHGLAYNASLDQLIIFGGLTDGALLYDSWALMNVSKRRLKNPG